MYSRVDQGVDGQVDMQSCGTHGSSVGAHATLVGDAALICRPLSTSADFFSLWLPSPPLRDPCQAGNGLANRHHWLNACVDNQATSAIIGKPGKGSTP